MINFINDIVSDGDQNFFFVFFYLKNIYFYYDRRKLNTDLERYKQLLLKLLTLYLLGDSSDIQDRVIAGLKQITGLA